jgi:hypothetical protein
MRDPNENIKIMDKWLNEVSINNDNKIKQTEKLKIILFNLKIVEAGNKAVEPITDALSQIIKDIHDSTDILVHKGRDELHESFKELKEFISQVTLK